MERATDSHSEHSARGPQVRYRCIDARTIADDMEQPGDRHQQKGTAQKHPIDAVGTLVGLVEIVSSDEQDTEPDEPDGNDHA